MENNISQIDYGTGHKNLRVYLIGLIWCVFFTLIAFLVVMHRHFNDMDTLAIIYIAAILQFVVQVICFLRLNTETPQARNNVMALLFTIVILICIIVGSLWIMSNLGYYMAH